MYRIALESIDNVAIWPVISLSIFFAFFLVLIYYVFTANKSYITRMKNMPLEGDTLDPVAPHKP
jgi:hypothetical protein